MSAKQIRRHDFSLHFVLLTAVAHLAEKGLVQTYQNTDGQKCCPASFAEFTPGAQKAMSLRCGWGLSLEACLKGRVFRGVVSAEFRVVIGKCV